MPCRGAAASDRATPCPDRRLALWATVIASSLTFVLGAIVNVALPQMQAGLGTDAAGAQWIVNAYLLPLAALVLLGGALGDRYGRRRAFLAGLGLFAASLMGCALAPSLPVLLAFRAVEGAAAALIAPTSLAILSDAFPGRERGRAVGTWAAAGAAAGAVAPVLGGAIVDLAGWRWAFGAMLPVTGAAIWLALRGVRESRAPEAECAPLDLGGAALATLGLLALTWGLVALPQRGADAAALGALAAGAALLGAFLLVERRKGAGAMVPLRLFARPTFAGLSAFTFAIYAALGGLMLLLPYVLIRDLGYSATAAGAAMLPFPLTLGLLSRYAGGTLVERVGPRRLLAAGAALVACGFALFGRVPATGATYWADILPALTVLALGMSACAAPLTGAVLASAGERYAGVASGINNAISRVGGLIATALLGLVLLGAGDALLAGLAAAAWVGAGLAALAVLAALTLVRDDG
jgi:EmrB/QacA subfamily drug resistance transporter